MKNNKYIIGLFLCLFAVQIAVPVYMIVNKEKTLVLGKQFKFRTVPVDPYDAFRGRYVALAVQQDSAPVPGDIKLVSGQNVYACIEEDKDGFAKIIGVSKGRPKEGNYFRARVRYADGNKVRLDLPFTRYYMDEKKAPAAEDAYRKHSQKDKQDAYITVRVRNGCAVIEELYINEKPISELWGHNT